VEELTLEARPGDALERDRTPAALAALWGLAGWVRLKKRIVGGNLVTNAWLFDGFSSRCREIRAGAATWRALDVIYNHYFQTHPNWQGTQNAA